MCDKQIIIAVGIWKSWRFERLQLQQIIKNGEIIFKTTIRGRLNNDRRSNIDSKYLAAKSVQMTFQN